MAPLLQQPSNTIIDWYIDQYIWWSLQLYFLPYRLPEYGGDVDKWVSTFSLNGIKSSNLCKPKVSE
jgi:hypothetical protein